MPAGFHHQNNISHFTVESHNHQPAATVGTTTANHHTAKHRQKSRRTNANPKSTASQSLRGRISAVTWSSRITSPPSA